MHRNLPFIEERMRSALALESRERWPEACEVYLQVIDTAPRWPVGYLCLGCALARLGQPDRAAQVLSLGHDRSPMLLTLWRKPDTERPVAERSKYADTLLRRVLTGMHDASVRAYEAEAGCGPLGRVRSAIWCQTHDRPFRFADSRQRPWLLYLPDLEPRPWFDTTAIPWAAGMEARIPDLLQEIRRTIHDLGDAVQPYVPANAPVTPDLGELRGSSRWSSIHLYREGVAAADDVLAAFPCTLAALEGADCVRLEGNPMEVVVSMLAPGARIPPHCGLANTRLTVHVPVTVPAGCSLTVAGESRTPEEGRLLAFDDGFVHEAYNRASQPRTHLIFEAWRPDLDEHEKAALTRCIEDRGRWNRSRRLPRPGELAPS